MRPYFETMPSFGKELKENRITRTQESRVKLETVEAEIAALRKAHQAAGVIFFKGILANWIVCLAVRVALRCKDEVAKILVLILIVFIFVRVTFVPAAVLIGFWFVIQLLNLGAVVNVQTGGVAYMAHVVGFIFGALSARFLVDRQRVLELA